MSEISTHLKRVQVLGFKSIKELDLAMNPINILIGANGSGKSNFISLFTFLRHLSEGRLQTYVEKNGFANVFFHFGSKKTERIMIDLTVNNNSYHVEFVHGEANDALVFEEEYCTYSQSNKHFYVKGSLGESGLLPNSEKAAVFTTSMIRALQQPLSKWLMFADTEAVHYRQIV